MVYVVVMYVYLRQIVLVHFAALKWHLVAWSKINMIFSLNASDSIGYLNSYIIISLNRLIQMAQDNWRMQKKKKSHIKIKFNHKHLVIHTSK